MHIDEFSIEEFGPGMIIRPIIIQANGFLLDRAPCIEGIVVFECQIPIDRLPTIGRIRLDAVDGEIFQRGYERVLARL